MDSNGWTNVRNSRLYIHVEYTSIFFYPFFHTILQVKDYHNLYHAKKWGEVATTRNGEDIILLGGLKKKRVTPKMMCLMNFSGAWHPN